MKCTRAREKSDKTDLFPTERVKVSPDVDANVERVCVCVRAVSSNAAAAASPGERRAPRAPGTSRCPELDHAGSRVSEADRCRLAGVHPQPDWGRPAGDVQVLHLSACLSAFNLVRSRLYCDIRDLSSLEDYKDYNTCTCINLNISHSCIHTLSWCTASPNKWFPKNATQWFEADLFTAHF